MKKAIKIIWITLVSFVGLVLICIGILSWLVFTPSRLTPIVNNLSEKYISCQTRLDKVDLALWKTFPYFTIHIQNLLLVNPFEGAPCDTLLNVPDFYASIDIKALLKDKAAIVEKLYLNDGYANLYTDSLGHSNFAVFPSSDDSDTSSFSNPFTQINLNSVSVKDLDVSFIDLNNSTSASMEDFDLKVSMQMEEYDVSGSLEAEISSMSLFLAGDKYLQNVPVDILLPFSIDTYSGQLSLYDSKVSLDKYLLQLDGIAMKREEEGYMLDIGYKADKWDVDELFEFLPRVIIGSVDDIFSGGIIQFHGEIFGTIASGTLPLIDAYVSYREGNAKFDFLPFHFSKLNTDFLAFIDLNNKPASKVDLYRLDAVTGNTSLSLTGKADDFMGEILCDLNLKGNLDLKDINRLIPSSLPVKIEGLCNADLKGIFTLDQLLGLDLNHIKLSGTLDFSDFDATYSDTLFVSTSDLSMDLELPIKNNSSKLLSANIGASSLDLMVGSLMYVELLNAKVALLASDFTDTLKFPEISGKLTMQGLSATKDTISFAIYEPECSFESTPAVSNQRSPHIVFDYCSNSLYASVGREITIDTEYIDIEGSVTNDNSKQGFLAIWNPNLKVDFNKGSLLKDGIPFPVEIPSIKFDFSPEKFHIDNSSLILDKSDFSLVGDITNIPAYLDNTGLLTANLAFVSSRTDVNQLLDIVSGFGLKEPSMQDQGAVDTLEVVESEPFIVPLGVDFLLNTSIKEAIVTNTIFNNVKGDVKVQNGVLVIEEMGFTSDAARMQLTGMYRSPRPNHLFVGLDFHLLDIEIDKLIHIIPDIDTIVPMLKSFAGKAEFHLAAETYMKSDYSLKPSTLRGAAALEGKNLVLLDSDTYRKISRLLMFDKQSENKIDSLFVEMSVFRNEIDIYPFLIKMDDYQAIISGRHNLDMTFDYHLDCWLPTRVGLDVSGSFDNLRYKLVPCKYVNLFTPEKRNKEQEQVIALKKLISESLKSTVKQ